MYKYDNNEFDEIFILHTAFLGDIFISYFLIDKLKQINPLSKITFITTPIMFEASKMIKSIDSVLVFDKRGSHKKISEAKKFGSNFNKNSLFISLHRSLRSSVMAYFSNSRAKLVWDNASLSMFFSNKVKYKHHFNEQKRLNEFLNFFDSKNLDSELPDLNFELAPIPEKYERSILLFPGSVWETKKWKKEHFATLSEMLIEKGHKVLLCGSKNEIELCNFISERSNVENIAGKLTLSETVSLVARAKFVICNDSAPTHIASLVGTPMLTIFGPTSPIFGFAPKSDNYIYLEKECSPCNIHGPKACPLAHHNCMVDITPEMVFDRIDL